MKKLILLVLFIFIFSLPANAAESIYEQSYAGAGLADTENLLPDSAKEILSDNGIDVKNPQWYEEFSGINAAKSIFEIIKSGFARPVKSLAAILALILIAALGSAVGKPETKEIYGNFFALIICAYVIKNVFYIIATAVAALKAGATFMLGIVPIFSSVAVLSGNTHAAGTSALILAAAEIISTLCAFAVVPIMSAYTAISIASGVSPIVGGDLSSSLKTAANFIMGFICTAFLGLVSVQSSIGAAADSFKMKTARFLVGSLVPATGTALSEAVTTVSGSMALLKSSVGIYAVFGVAAVILPVLAELAAWRISLNLSAAAAAAFSVKSVGKVFGSIDSALSLLMGITVFTGAIFIISMGIVVSVKC